MAGNEDMGAQDLMYELVIYCTVASWSLLNFWSLVVGFWVVIVMLWIKKITQLYDGIPCVQCRRKMRVISKALTFVILFTVPVNVLHVSMACVLV